MRKFLLGLAGTIALAFVAMPAHATVVAGGNVCPQAGSASVGAAYTSAVAATGTCNIVITFNSDGSIGTSLANPNPYDGSDDQLVGVVNNTSHVITSFSISGPDTGNGGPFGFDGDGICAYTPFASNSQPCNGGYLGGASSFSGINGTNTSGTVNFVGIASGGGTSYFSLEEPASLNLRVGSTPEPGTLVMFGTGLIGLAGAIRRKLRV